MGHAARNNKKRQHYVWRQYLKPWATDGLIVMYSKSRECFRSTGLGSVAVESYFYDHKPLNEQENALAEGIIRRMLPPETAAQPLQYLDTIRCFHNLAQRAAGTNDDELSQCIESVNREIRSLGEDWQCTVEDSGYKYLQMIINKDLSFYLDKTKRVEFCHFLVTQHIRTKKAKESMRDTLPLNPGLEVRPERVLNVVLPAIAVRVTVGMAELAPTSLMLLVNSTEIPLITADQPSLNLKQHSRDAQGLVAEFEMYYPVSPQLAVLVVRSNSFDVGEATLSLERVRELNASVFENALDQVYGTDEESIRRAFPTPAR